MKNLNVYILTLLVLVSSCTCSPKKEAVKADPAVPSKCNGIYHWKTTFNLNTEEKNFLRKHSVKRIYVRMFDVDMETAPLTRHYGAIPIGTTTFREGAPKGVEIIPCVFITTRAMAIEGGRRESIKSLAKKIYTRVSNMMEYNELGPLKEIQLDCDWNQSTKGGFYGLCEEIKSLCGDSVLVSSTIRLHQLRDNPPPVDKGVLMVYNTGALRLSGPKSSILDFDDVKAYMKSEMRYGLPLDFAFPAYGWGVLFRDGQFRCLLHHTDYGNAAYYSPQEDGSFLVAKDHILEGKPLEKGDVIRLEYPDADLVAKVAALVSSSIQSNPHSVILYHLDSANLAKYSDDEISKIYSY